MPDEFKPRDPREAEAAYRNQILRDAQMAMRGMLSSSYGTGAGGVFIEPVKLPGPGQPVMPERQQLDNRLEELERAAGVTEEDRFAAQERLTLEVNNQVADALRAEADRMEQQLQSAAQDPDLGFETFDRSRPSLEPPPTTEPPPEPLQRPQQREPPPPPEMASPQPSADAPPQPEPIERLQPPPAPEPPPVQPEPAPAPSPPTPPEMEEMLREQLAPRRDGESQPIWPPGSGVTSDQDPAAREQAVREAAEHLAQGRQFGPTHRNADPARQTDGTIGPIPDVGGQDPFLHAQDQAQQTVQAPEAGVEVVAYAGEAADNLVALLKQMASILEWMRDQFSDISNELDTDGEDELL